MCSKTQASDAKFDISNFLSGLKGIFEGYSSMNSLRSGSQPKKSSMNNAYEKKIIFQAKMCFWRAFPAEKIAESKINRNCIFIKHIQGFHKNPIAPF